MHLNTGLQEPQDLSLPSDDIIVSISSFSTAYDMKSTLAMRIGEGLS